MKISLNKIKLDPNQPRKIIDQKSVMNLAKSMKVEGLIHPIEVDKSYTIIVGEVRYRAAKSLNWSEIEANVYKGDLTPYERLRRQMAENLQQSGAKGGGQPMNAIDTARAWAMLYRLKIGKDYKPGLQSREEIYGKFKDIAEEVGVERETVYEHLRLLEQPKYVIEDLLKGRPRTFYREAERLPEKIGEVEIREPIKRGISKDRIESRDQIIRLQRTLSTKPEKALSEMSRIFEKHSKEANLFMDKALELQIAISNSHPEKWSTADKNETLKLFSSLPGIVTDFMRKLNKE